MKLRKMNIKTSILLLFVLIDVSLSGREHKVHNIVLYPEKYSWCQTTPIQQIVASPGFEPVTINNSVCVGACYSYSIPKTQPAEPGELIGPYCDSCQPAKIKCYHVNLKADEKNVEGPRTIQKRVQIIEECACMTCDEVRKEDCEITDGSTSELPSNLFFYSNTTNKSQPEEEPELLRKQNKVYNMFEAKLQHKKFMSWLKSFGMNESQLEEFDNPKIRDKLMKHGKFDIGNNDDSDEPITFDLGGNPSIQDEIIYDSDPKPNEIPEATSKKSIDHSSGTTEGQIRHHHHLGEEQVVGKSVQHLIKGPHGSYVLSPVEKFHIDTDDLKTNNEGTVVSYENHDQNSKNDLVN